MNFEVNKLYNRSQGVNECVRLRPTIPGKSHTFLYRDKKEKVAEGSKPDFLDMDKDGDKKEPMKKAAGDKGGDKKDGKKDDKKDAKKDEKKGAKPAAKN